MIEGSPAMVGNPNNIDATPNGDFGIFGRTYTLDEDRQANSVAVSLDLVPGQPFPQPL